MVQCPPYRDWWIGKPCQLKYNTMGWLESKTDLIYTKSHFLAKADSHSPSWSMCSIPPSKINYYLFPCTRKLFVVVACLFSHFLQRRVFWPPAGDEYHFEGKKFQYAFLLNKAVFCHFLSDFQQPTNISPCCYLPFSFWVHTSFISLLF